LRLKCGKQKESAKLALLKSTVVGVKPGGTLIFSYVVNKISVYKN
jgi:hypothetical protein